MSLVGFAELLTPAVIAVPRDARPIGLLVFESMDAGPEQRDLEDLVFECLERIESEGPGALEAMCREHPVAETRLRERIGLLRRMGLQGTPDGATSVPERLGDFRLIQRLGAGGMGVVYLAEQVSLGRPVALKLIRPEQLYFANSRERFQREIDAIARLQHPSIVPIHASGQEGGIPYYAMEHVRGVSLAQVLAAFAGRDPAHVRGRDLRDLVLAAAPRGADPTGDLFAGSWGEVSARIARALALAVQHAHERGVLHRDIKPSNVMIAADGRVVLLDFGLASLGSTGELTRTGSQIGSLPYMSPEQLRGQADRFGARTDVYGIGVTLYELLALRPAFVDTGDTESLRASILEPRPRALKDLHPGIGGDLVLVCRTAMQPDPSVRYPSAAALAADLTCVIEMRPIAARAPSVVARLASWARRQPARATAAALGIALVVGGPLLYALQQQASNARVAAVNVELTAALSESERQRILADANLRKALESVDVMLTRVGQETLRDVPQMVSIRRALLEDALRYYTGFLEQRAGDPELRRQVELARSRVSSLHMTLGDLADAERELTALAAGMRAEAERADASDDTLRTFADVVGRLGEVQSRRGSFEESRARIEEAIATFDRIPADRRDAQMELQRGGSHDKLAELLQRSGRTAEAERSAREAVAITRAGLEKFPAANSFQLAIGRQLDRLGTLLVRQRRIPEGVTHLEESVSFLERYHALVPSDTHGREKLMTARINLANGRIAGGDAEGARALSQLAVEAGEELVRDFPDVPSYQTDLAIAHMQLFVHAYRAGDLELAEDHIERTIDLQEAAARSKPMDGSFLGEMAGSCNNLAALQERRGDHAASIATAERGIAHAQAALAAAPLNPQWRELQRSLQNNRGMALIAAGRWRDASLAVGEIDAGEEHEWYSRRAQLLERASRVAALDPNFASEAHGLRERAVADLERAVELGRNEWSELGDPDEWATLREDPRFVALVARSSQPR
ncbi:MAG: protein kinase [Planctomycetota bacterium]|nr:protein kinase [Planctomycetota bacterium]